MNHRPPSGELIQPIFYLIPSQVPRRPCIPHQPSSPRAHPHRHLADCPCRHPVRLPMFHTAMTPLPQLPHPRNERHRHHHTRPRPNRQSVFHQRPPRRWTRPLSTGRAGWRERKSCRSSIGRSGWSWLSQNNTSATSPPLPVQCKPHSPLPTAPCPSRNPLPLSQKQYQRTISCAQAVKAATQLPSRRLMQGRIRQARPRLMLITHRRHFILHRC